MFGHQIVLNFNKNGDSHTTFIGGFFSILVKVVMGIYVYMNFMKLFMMEDAQIETKIFSLNLTAHPEVDYDDAKSTIFWVMRKTENSQRPFMLDTEEIDQYFEFSAVQWDSNWYLPKAQWHNYTKVPMRKCKLADFCFSKTDEECTDKHRRKYFNDWTGFSTICVNKDHEDYKGLKLKGDPGSMISRKIIFQIQMCDPETKQGAPCKSEEVIKQYAKDLTIEEWLVQRKVYFEKYQEETTYSVMEMKS